MRRVDILKCGDVDTWRNPSNQVPIMLWPDIICSNCKMGMGGILPHKSIQARKRWKELTGK